uniref:Uncharacterized protein n=1 Tax=Anguilla anguilla TaxID=7936 RepID=A0A0E9RTG6_ANGAN
MYSFKIIRNVCFLNILHHTQKLFGPYGKTEMLFCKLSL